MWFCCECVSESESDRTNSIVNALILSVHYHIYQFNALDCPFSMHNKVIFIQLTFKKRFKMLKASAIHFTWYLYMHNYPYNFIFPSRLFFLIGSPFMSFDVCARPVFTAIKFIEKSLKHTRWILHTCTCHKWINDEESQERGKEWNEMERNENKNTKIKSESERLKKKLREIVKKTICIQ